MLTFNLELSIYNELLSFIIRYLLEKDINGDVMCELDLKCLLKLAPVENESHSCLKLTFDYVNKSKRDRCYVMENMPTRTVSITANSNYKYLAEVDFLCVSEKSYIILSMNST